MDGMTIKQIAELCGAGETTVRRWIDTVPFAEMAKPSAEIAKVSNEPFRFTLPETLAIIRAGGKSTLADLLEDNAQRKETAVAVRDAVQDQIKALLPAIVQALRSTPDLLALPAPEIPQDYYTIKMYAALRGMWVGNSTAVTFGRHAAELSRIQGKEVKRIPVPGSEIRQEVSAFHISILQEVFTL